MCCWEIIENNTNPVEVELRFENLVQKQFRTTLIVEIFNDLIFDFYLKFQANSKEFTFLIFFLFLI